MTPIEVLRYIVESVDRGIYDARAFAQMAREMLAKEDADMIQHKSDCSVHNEPAYPAGPCDCGEEHPQSCGGTFNGLGLGADGIWRGRCVNHDNRLVQYIDGRYLYDKTQERTP